MEKVCERCIWGINELQLKLFRLNQKRCLCAGLLLQSCWKLCCFFPNALIHYRCCMFFTPELSPPLLMCCSDPDWLLLCCSRAMSEEQWDTLISMAHHTQILEIEVNNKTSKTVRRWLKIWVWPYLYLIPILYTLSIYIYWIKPMSHSFYASTRDEGWKLHSIILAVIPIIFPVYELNSGVQLLH